MFSTTSESNVGFGLLCIGFILLFWFKRKKLVDEYKASHFFKDFFAMIFAIADFPTEPSTFYAFPIGFILMGVVVLADALWRHRVIG